MLALLLVTASAYKSLAVFHPEYVEYLYIDYCYHLATSTFKVIQGENEKFTMHKFTEPDCSGNASVVPFMVVKENTAFDANMTFIGSMVESQFAENCSGIEQFPKTFFLPGNCTAVMQFGTQKSIRYDLSPNGKLTLWEFFSSDCSGEGGIVVDPDCGSCFSDLGQTYRRVYDCNPVTMTPDGQPGHLGGDSSSCSSSTPNSMSSSSGAPFLAVVLALAVGFLLL